MSGEIKDVIKGIITDLKTKEEKEAGFLKVWEKAAGKRAAKHAKPVFFKKKRLVVNVTDSSWLYKLTLDKETLVDKFNKNMKDRKRRIKELQFRVGKV
jgi:predicted nucleic acid-binding Zn ribbon protein